MRQVFVTGASSDIGCAVCEAYLSEGFKVVGHYNNGQPRFFSLVKQSPNMTALQIDFANPENLERAIADDPDIFKATDVIVNAVGLFEPMPFKEVSADAVLRAMTVNLLPGLLLMRSITPAMNDRGWGRIIHLSSIGVKFHGGKSSFTYALSKHAMEFIPSDYQSWAANNVYVNVLRLGVTDTRIHSKNPDKNMDDRIALIPAGRMATPEEIAQAIFWHGSNKNTYITGQVLTIAGGE
jgi:NAD(P)-dependent dehydrogenase (short-subunit alcohol dehydrogenase family)